MYQASKPPAAQCQLESTYLTGSLSEPGEERSFKAGSQAAFLLTLGCADVRWAAAGLPAEREWVGVLPSPIDSPGGCFLSALPLTGYHMAS